MRALRFLAGLAGLFLVHVLAVRLIPGFALAIDLFVLILVFHALDGNTLAGMLGGLVVGLAEDSLSGGLYGLHGLAGTVVGYAAARAAQQLVVQQASVVGFFCAIGLVLHELLLTALSRMLFAEAPSPALAWVTVRASTTALLGMLLWVGRARLDRRLEVWRRDRQSRIRLN